LGEVSGEAGRKLPSCCCKLGKAFQQNASLEAGRAAAGWRGQSCPWIAPVLPECFAKQMLISSQALNHKAARGTASMVVQ